MYILLFNSVTTLKFNAFIVIIFVIKKLRLERLGFI